MQIFVIKLYNKKSKLIENIKVVFLHPSLVHLKFHKGSLNASILFLCVFYNLQSTTVTNSFHDADVNVASRIWSTQKDIITRVAIQLGPLSGYSLLESSGLPACKRGVGSRGSWDAMPGCCVLATADVLGYVEGTLSYSQVGARSSLCRPCTCVLWKHKFTGKKVTRILYGWIFYGAMTFR